MSEPRSETHAATVLIVDDERGPRESLRMILAPTHRVVCAKTGSEALELLESEPVDVVTLDLNMPGMLGDEVMRTVREKHPHVEIIVITGCGSLESATEGIRFGICDYLQKPFDVVQVMGAVTRALARRKARTGLVSFLEALGDVVGREADAAAILEEVQRSQKIRGRLRALVGEQGEAQDRSQTDEHTVEFLEVLAETIETKDRFMRGHARRVAFYAGLVADRLALPVETQERVRISAFLHDLGKVGVPTDLLLRAGALEPAEREIVERHPVIGAHLLNPLDLPYVIPVAIRHHHEWWDGSGYPDGLSGEEIPLEARIIAVADAFDAMTCDRPYRQALRREIVVSELKRYAGIQFDPQIATLFLEILEEGVADVDVLTLAESASAPGSSATEQPAA
ncbi:MAG: HD domain-containing phosphohydrolase [Myxococcota bacterium]